MTVNVGTSRVSFLDKNQTTLQFNQASIVSGSGGGGEPPTTSGWDTNWNYSWDGDSVLPTQ